MRYLYLITLILAILGCAGTKDPVGTYDLEGGMKVKRYKYTPSRLMSLLGEKTKIINEEVPDLAEETAQSLNHWGLIFSVFGAFLFFLGFIGHWWSKSRLYQLVAEISLMVGIAASATGLYLIGLSLIPWWVWIIIAVLVVAAIWILINNRNKSPLDLLTLNTEK